MTYFIVSNNLYYAFVQCRRQNGGDIKEIIKNNKIVKKFDQILY